MDGGIAEIERQQGWSCKKKDGPTKELRSWTCKKNVSCKSEVLADVAGGGWGAMPSPSLPVPHNFLLFTATQSTFQSYLYVFQILH